MELPTQEELRARFLRMFKYEAIDESGKIIPLTPVTSLWAWLDQGRYGAEVVVVDPSQSWLWLNYNGQDKVAATNVKEFAAKANMEIGAHNNNLQMFCTRVEHQPHKLDLSSIPAAYFDI